MTDYISLLKEEFSYLNADEIRMIKSIGMVYEAQQDAYDFMKKCLKMKNKKFEIFKTREEFQAEWDHFCESEQEFIKQL